MKLKIFLLILLIPLAIFSQSGPPPMPSPLSNMVQNVGAGTSTWNTVLTPITQVIVAKGTESWTNNAHSIIFPNYTSPRADGIPERLMFIDPISGAVKISGPFPFDTRYLQSYIETDPSISAWAKAPSKPSYTASEVGAYPATGNPSGFIINETDPNIYAWAKSSTKPTYTPSEVGAYPATGNPSGYISTELDGTVPPYAKTLTGFPVIKSSTDDLYEPIISPKNTAFNLNLGTAAGTVAQGNDSRIVNGQTAFGWGNHASAGYLLSSNFNSSFDGRLALKSTDNLAEGTTNLYFTNTRVLAATATAYKPQSYTPTSSEITTALGYTPVNPNGTNAQYIAGDGTKVTFPIIPTILPKVYSTPTFASSTTATQLSATREAYVQYSYDATVNITIIAGQSVTATLQYADNIGMTTNLTVLDASASNNSGVLGLSQTNTLKVSGFVPAGKYRRVVFAVTGTGTATPSALKSGQEVLQ